MPLVAIDPASGIGNQLFMMAAALGYAERCGGEVVYWDEPKSSWEHKGSQFRVKEMFPFRVLTAAERQGDWAVFKEPWTANFSYYTLPIVGKNVKLEGYFQSDLFGPSTFPTPPSPPALRAELIPHAWHKTFFLHVRRGDYLDPANAHHAVDLQDYWRQCLREMPVDWTCFVVSDDMAWCRRELEGIVGNVWKGKWLWCPEGLSDVETFFWMRACTGGICANSTFSWWAAWYVKRRIPGAKLYMPRVWGYPPLPPTRDLYPAWALVRG
jgi:hypothetical protein